MTPSTPVPKPPSTGDMIHMGLWIGMGLVTLIALLVVLWKNRKK
ncbi:LPXTG cell wall anchor domain-containing protein [Kallipyga massiliensis]|nr:LPXTG cell wall anchor domain-containing protein [Kallipyga massiliensis]